MTTKNRAIACYLPSNIEQKLIEYCHNEGILQSDGTTPKMGTGILKILELFFGVIPSDALSDIPKETLEETVKGILLEVLPSNVPTVDEVISPSQLDHRAEGIITQFEDAIAQLNKRIEALEKTTSHQDASKNDEKPKNGEIQVKPTKPPAFKHPTLFEQEDASSDSEQELTDRELAEKLGVKTATVNRWKNGERTPSGANKDLFLKWEARNGLWYRKNES